MRVISGTAKGRTIKAPKGLATRPTADHVRQAIFDILGPSVAGVRVLDLYAGTGAMGIEALSRGATEAVFVENASAAIAVLEKNLETTDLAGRATVRRVDVERYVTGSAVAAFGLVLIDPPYETGLASLGRVLAKLADGGWIAPGATMVVEAAKGAVAWPAGWTETRTRTFGRTQVSVAVSQDD